MYLSKKKKKKILTFTCANSHIINLLDVFADLCSFSKSDICILFFVTIILFLSQVSQCSLEAIYFYLNLKHYEDRFSRLV